MSTGWERVEWERVEWGRVEWERVEWEWVEWEARKLDKEAVVIIDFSTYPDFSKLFPQISQETDFYRLGIKVGEKEGEGT